MTEQEEFEFRARLEQELAQQQQKQQPQEANTIGRQLGLTGRAAITGITGIPNMIGDVINTGLNQIPGVNLQLPSKATQQLMTKAGIPEPQNQLERVVQAAASSLAGTGGIIKGAQALQGAAQSPVSKGVLQQLAAKPNAQLAAAAPSGAASQYVTEETGSPLSGMLAGTVAGAAAGVRPRQAEPTPLADVVKQQAKEAYKIADNAGIMVKPSAFSPALQEMKDIVNKQGFDPMLHPQINRVISRIEEDAAKGVLTLGELDKLRQVIKNAVPSSDNNQARLANLLTNKLDDFVNNLSFKDVNSIDPKVGVNALKEARTLWSRTKKAEIIDDMMTSAEIKSSLPNASENELLRKSIINLAADKNKMKQFTEAEQNMIKSAAKGGNLQRVLQIFEQIAPGSSLASVARSTAGSTAAGLALGPVGFIGAPLIGVASKKLAGSMAANNAEKLRNSLLLGREFQTTTRGALTPTTATTGLLSSYLQQGNQ